MVTASDLTDSAASQIDTPLTAVPNGGKNGYGPDADPRCRGIGHSVGTSGAGFKVI